MNRIESGAVHALLKRVRLADVIDDAVERSGSALAGHPVHVDSAAGLEASIDASLVVHALCNLLDNAAKYSPPGSPILVDCREREGRAEVAVEDQGPGIPAEDRERVFERFYRARGEATKVKGSGLGLALVQGFVSLSGGSVRVEPSDSGARFVLSFPVATRPALAV